MPGFIITFPGLRLPDGSARSKECDLFPISVGQEYQMGECLEATVAEINKHSNTIGQVVILMASTLQAETHQLLKISPQEARKIAIAKGVQWLIHAQPILENLKVPYCVIDWEELIATVQFKNLYESLLNLIDYEYNQKPDPTNDKSASPLKLAIDAAATTFYSHFYNLHEEQAESDMKIALPLCRKYIKGEAAVIKMLQYYFERQVYPATHSTLNKRVFDAINTINDQKVRIELPQQITLHHIEYLRPDFTPTDYGVFEFANIIENKDVKQLVAGTLQHRDGTLLTQFSVQALFSTRTIILNKKPGRMSMQDIKIEREKNRPNSWPKPVSLRVGTSSSLSPRSVSAPSSSPRNVSVVVTGEGPIAASTASGQPPERAVTRPVAIAVRKDGIHSNVIALVQQYETRDATAATNGNGKRESQELSATANALIKTSPSTSPPYAKIGVEEQQQKERSEQRSDARHEAKDKHKQVLAFEKGMKAGRDQAMVDVISAIATDPEHRPDEKLAWLKKIVDKAVEEQPGTTASQSHVVIYGDASASRNTIFGQSATVTIPKRPPEGGTVTNTAHAHVTSAPPTSRAL